MPRLLIFAVRAVLVVLALAAGAAAQEPSEPTPAERVEVWSQRSESVEEVIAKGDLTIQTVDRMRRQLSATIDEMAPIQARLREQIAPLRSQLEALSPAPQEGEATEAAPPPEARQSAETAGVAAERERLQSRIAELDALLKRVDSEEVRAKALLNQLASIRRELFTARLMSRGPSLLEPSTLQGATASVIETAEAVVEETRFELEAARMDVPLIVAFLVPIAVVCAALLAVFRLKNVAVGRLVRRITPETPHSERVAIGAALTLARLALPTIGVALSAGVLLYSGVTGPQGRLIVEGLAEAATVLIGAYALGGAFFAPKAPLLRPKILADCDAVLAHRWMIVLAGIVGLDRLLVRQGEAIGLTVEALTLFNTSLLVVGGIALWRFMGAIHAPAPPATEAPAATPRDEEDEDPEDQADRSGGTVMRPAVQALRLVARFVAVTAPLFALGGYYALGRFAFYPLVFTIAVIAACILLAYVVSSLVDRVSAPAGAAGETADAGAPSANGTSFSSRLKLIPIVVTTLLACIAVPIIALIWGASPEDLSTAWRAFRDGFRIGEVTISPVDFITFAIVISIGLLVTDRVKRALRRSVLPLTGLDQGGRDAVAAGAGYLGLVISALIAISAAGIDLSNLAIVAGALSVGIGFGLQNIVNNFVSGVILLIERPIKVGDWVELPSGMGYVKAVNVRSTEIETFDRSSLFVPNSELISGTVINWTHSNLNGRIIVKVGVAYSSDPRQVERILLEVGRGHPMMLRRPAPFVLFRGFGADALDFEIRGILRDVNWVLNVQSDLYFEIARRFAEEGIEIPFKQADIKLKNMDEIAEAIAAMNRPQAAPPAHGGEEAAAPAHGDGDDAAPAPKPRRRGKPRHPEPAGRPSGDDGAPDGEASGADGDR